MYITHVQANGSVTLGEQAELLGFIPGTLVQVSRLSSGNLLIALDHETVDMELTGVSPTYNRKQAASLARRSLVQLGRTGRREVVVAGSLWESGAHPGGCTFTRKRKRGHNGDPTE